MYKLNRLIKDIRHTLTDIPGWHTIRKMVVIESDDWGSIRMPSKGVYDRLLAYGYDVDQCPYCRCDALESEADLSGLFEVLSAFTDSQGNHPVITANTVVANPDFEKIKASEYKEYHYELFTETFKRYPRHKHSFQLWSEGMEKHIFQPQFHGREHVNVPLWLRALQKRERTTFRSFENQLFGVKTPTRNGLRSDFMAALDYTYAADNPYILQALSDGINSFAQIFGVHPNSFISNCYIWDDTVEKTLYENEIKYIQGISYQYYPSYIRSGQNKTKKYHYLGQKNEYKQLYLVRNCFFEPSLLPQVDHVNECLRRIQQAFNCYRPAIISMHRVNVIGSIVPKNQSEGLKQFRTLLGQIISRWPDVEFLSSGQLGDTITAE